MTTTLEIAYEEIDGDEPIVMATNLYEMHGFQNALKTVSQYIEAAENYTERFEWEKIAKELTILGITDQEIERAGLG